MYPIALSLFFTGQVMILILFFHKSILNTQSFIKTWKGSMVFPCIVGLLRSI